MKKKTKIILATVLAFFITTLAVFVGVAAYWVGNVNNPAQQEIDDITITVGQGKDVTTTLDFSKVMSTFTSVTGKKLVPENRKNHSEDSANAVEEIKLKVKVKVLEATNQVSVSDNILKTIKVNVSEIKIDNQTTYSNLVNIVIKNSSSTNNNDHEAQTIVKVNDNVDTYEFEITVKLTEPNNQTEYNAIKGKQITFKLTASAV